MVKKIKKYLKFVVCCALILSLVAPSYAALSASDGSAFVTKAEFDSALSDFNARLTTFEAGINSKIDSQVSSYLDRNGIWNGKIQTVLPGTGTYFAPSWCLLPPAWSFGQPVGDRTDQKRVGWIAENYFTDAFAPEMGNATKLLVATKSGLLNLNFKFRTPNYWARESKSINGSAFMATPLNWAGVPAGACYAFFTGNLNFVDTPVSGTSAGPFNNYTGLDYNTAILYAGQSPANLHECWDFGVPEEGIYPQLRQPMYKFLDHTRIVTATIGSNRNVGWEILKGDPRGTFVLLADSLTINETLIDGGAYYNGSMFARNKGSVTMWFMPEKNYSSYAFVSKGDEVWIRNSWTNYMSSSFIFGCQITSSTVSAFCPWACNVSEASIY